MISLGKANSVTWRESVSSRVSHKCLNFSCRYNIMVWYVILPSMITPSFRVVQNVSPYSSYYEHAIPGSSWANWVIACMENELIGEWCLPLGEHVCSLRCEVASLSTCTRDIPADDRIWGTSRCLWIPNSKKRSQQSNFHMRFSQRSIISTLLGCSFRIGTCRSQNSW